MNPIDPSASAMQDIVVARCGSLRDAEAMSRWVLPSLRLWPGTSWHLWLVDASNRDAVKTAKLHGSDAEAGWRPVEREVSTRQDAICAILGEHHGLVILANHVVAAAAARRLEGLVARMTCFSASDPLATSLRKPYAAHGAAVAA